MDKETVTEELLPETEEAETATISDTAKGKKKKKVRTKKPKAVLTPEEKKKRRIKLAKRYSFLSFAILLSALLRTISIYVFVVPNEFAPGGVTGIATMVENMTKGGISSGILIFAINMPLLIASFFLISKRFAICSSIGIVLQSGMLVLLNKLAEQVQWIGALRYSDQPVLAAIAGGVLGGIGIGLMLKIGASSGGTDIIATYIYKHFSATNISWFIFMMDSVVVIVSFFIYDNSLTPVLLSFVEMFASAKASDLIVCGFRGAVKFEIITSSADELSKELMQKLQRGVTAVPVRGMYTGEEKTMLVCLVRRSQISTFQKILAHYPNTFAYVSTTTDVMGQGFISDII